MIHRIMFRTGIAVIVSSLALTAAFVPLGTGRSAEAGGPTLQGGVVISGPPTPVDISRPFVRGDANIDGAVDLGDSIRILDYLFPTGPSIDVASLLPCLDAGDLNDDETVDIADTIYLLAFLFSGGAPPPAPFDACAVDPTSPPALTCLSYNACTLQTDLALAGHLLRRMAYGPTPDELDRVQLLGALAYINGQLNPDLLDDSDNDQLNSVIASLNPTTDRAHLQRLQFARGLYSDKQLLEQMVDFWNNHFNTYYFTVRNHFNQLRDDMGQDVYSGAESLVVATNEEYIEFEALRDGALGSFLDLLETSATSPTMLIYLDNITNVVGNANENYARELLELHCMGDDNGYTQEDIEEVARCFTGWTICKKSAVDADDPLAPCLDVNDPTGVWSFHFDADQHDYAQKIIFEGTPYELVVSASTPGDAVAGLADGFLVLEHVSGLQQTAEFVSTKLIAKFVDDEVPPALLASCIGTWLTTDGDMQAVMETILTSDQFLGEDHRWAKLETPMESVLSTVRAFQGLTATNPVRNAISAMNHLPFYFSTPDGFPEIDFLGTAKLLERFRFNSRIYNSSDPAYDLVELLESRGIAAEDPTAIVEFFLTLLYQERYTTEERDQAITFLSTDDFGNPVPLDSAAVDYESRLEKVAAFLASFPQGTQQ